MIIRTFTEIAGRPVNAAHLVAGDMEVTLLSYGAITRNWLIGGRNILLGYEDAADRYDHGAIAGRVAHRISQGEFAHGPGEVQLPPDFPSQIVTPELPYRQTLTIEVS